MNAGEKVILILSIWLVAAALYRMRKALYAYRTRHWLPLSDDTAWMLDRGFRCEMPPSALPQIALAGALSLVVVLL